MQGELIKKSIIFAYSGTALDLETNLENIKKSLENAQNPKIFRLRRYETAVSAAQLRPISEGACRRPPAAVPTPCTCSRRGPRCRNTTDALLATAAAFGRSFIVPALSS